MSELTKADFDLFFSQVRDGHVTIDLTEDQKLDLFGAMEEVDMSKDIARRVKHTYERLLCFGEQRSVHFTQIVMFVYLFNLGRMFEIRRRTQNELEKMVGA